MRRSGAYHRKTMKILKGGLSKLYANSAFGLLKNLVLTGCAAFTGLSVISTSTFVPTAYGFASDKIEWLNSTVSPLAVVCGGMGVVIVCCLLVGHELHAAGPPKRWIAAPAVLAVIAAVMAVLSVFSLQEEGPLKTKRVMVVIGVSNLKAVERAGSTGQVSPSAPKATGSPVIEQTQPITATGAEAKGTTSSVPLKGEGGSGSGCACPRGPLVVRPSPSEEGGGGGEENVAPPEGSEIEEESSSEAEAATEARAEAQEAAAEARAEAEEAAAEARAEAQEAAAEARAEAAAE